MRLRDGVGDAPMLKPMLYIYRVLTACCLVFISTRDVK